MERKTREKRRRQSWWAIGEPQDGVRGGELRCKSEKRDGLRMFPKVRAGDKVKKGIAKCIRFAEKSFEFCLQRWVVRGARRSDKRFAWP